MRPDCQPFFVIFMFFSLNFTGNASRYEAKLRNLPFTRAGLMPLLPPAMLGWVLTAN
jgi:hypothetical protein